MFIVKTIENFLSKDECHRIINENIDSNLLEAVVGVRREIKKNIRNSKINFIENNEIKEKLVNELKKHILLKGFQVAVIKEFQFTKYEVGGFYDWHMDYNPLHDGFNKRFYSSVIQLNDNYHGGELLYRDENEKEHIFKRGLGNLFIFNSSTYHKVNPITYGERYSLVNWLSVEEIPGFKKTLL